MFFPVKKKPFSWQFNFNFISKQLHFLNCIFIFGYKLAMLEEMSSQILISLLQRVTLDSATDYYQQ